MDQEEISKIYELLEEIRQIIAKNDSHLMQRTFHGELKKEGYPKCKKCGIGLLMLSAGIEKHWICPIHRDLGIQC